MKNRVRFEREDTAMLKGKSSVTILSTDSGSVEVQRQRNRVYVQLVSEQEEVLDSSLVLEALHELKHYVSHGFTMLLDARQVEFYPEGDSELLCDMMNLLHEGGLCKLAEVHAGAPALKLLPDCPAGRTDAGLQHAVFADRQEAEAWLDS